MRSPWLGRDAGAPNSFATSLEAAYPFPLARAIAQAFLSTQPDMSPVACSVDLQRIRAAVGVQPKASKVAPLVPEHAYKLLMQCNTCQLLLKNASPRTGPSRRLVSAGTRSWPNTRSFSTCRLVRVKRGISYHSPNNNREGDGTLFEQF